jgi:hypothetical protein
MPTIMADRPLFSILIFIVSSLGSPSRNGLVW